MQVWCREGQPVQACPFRPDLDGDEPVPGPQKGHWRTVFRHRNKLGRPDTGRCLLRTQQGWPWWAFGGSLRLPSAPMAGINSAFSPCSRHLSGTWAGGREVLVLPHSLPPSNQNRLHGKQHRAETPSQVRRPTAETAGLPPGGHGDPRLRRSPLARGAAMIPHGTKGTPRVRHLHCRIGRQMPLLRTILR